MTAKKPRRYDTRASFKDGLSVRYAVEWDEVRLDRAIRAAATNKSGKSTLGPIRIYVHPEDRLP